MGYSENPAPLTWPSSNKFSVVNWINGNPYDNRDTSEDVQSVCTCEYRIIRPSFFHATQAYNKSLWHELPSPLLAGSFGSLFWLINRAISLQHSTNSYVLVLYLTHWTYFSPQ